MPIDLIAFTGLAGSGKTTAAKALVHFHGYSRISFADPIRRMLMAIGLTAEDMADRKEVPHALIGFNTPRVAMQTLGTEWGRRTICDDLWLKIARRDIEQARAFPDFAGIVIDDCRFDNEAELIRSLGGVVVKVERGGQVAMANGHASEVGVNPALIDRVITAADHDVNGLSKMAVELVEFWEREMI